MEYNFINICDMLSGILTIEPDNIKNEIDFKKCHHVISTLPPRKWNEIILFLTGQKITNVDSYALYKQDYETMNFDLVTYIYNKNDSYYEFILNISDAHILLNAISPQTLAKYIKNNICQKNIYLPLIYACDTKDVGHIALIIINMQNKKIYLLDPNGTPTYFDNVLGDDNLLPISYHIEMVMSQYFSELSKYGMIFEYIPVSIWNEKHVCINKSFTNNYVGSGHCVIFTFLLSNLINILDISPSDIYKILNSYSDEELLFIIKEYSLGIYCILNYLK